MGKYYRHPKFGRVYGDTLWTSVGRLVWPALTAPKEETFNGQTTLRYGVTVLMPKNKPETQEFIDSVEGMINEEGGMLSIFNSYTKAKLALDDEIIRDGDTFDLEKYPYYADHYVLVARNQKEVDIRGPKGKGDVIEASAIIGGVKGRALVTPHLGPTGLSFRLERVQLAKDDGVRMGGGVRNLDAFQSAIEDEDCEETEVGSDEGIEEDGEQTSGDDQTVSENETDDAAPPVQETPKARGRPKGSTNAPSMREQVAAKANTKAVTNKPAITDPRATLRAQMSVKTGGAKVVTTGKGKGLALDNL